MKERGTTACLALVGSWPVPSAAVIQRKQTGFPQVCVQDCKQLSGMMEMLGGV